MSERAVFDMHIWVEGDTTLDVWRRVTELQRTASLLAPAGVTVRYVQLRDGKHTHDFDATMAPKRRKRAA